MNARFGSGVLVAVAFLAAAPVRGAGREANAATAPSTDSVKKFDEQMRGRIAKVAADKVEVESFLLSAKQNLAEQQKRTEIDKEGQANLQELLKRTGGAAEASDRIKRMLEALKLRRVTLTRLIGAGLYEKVDDFRAKRFEIEDRLFSATWIR